MVYGLYRDSELKRDIKNEIHKKDCTMNHTVAEINLRSPRDLEHDSVLFLII